VDRSGVKIQLIIGELKGIALIYHLVPKLSILQMIEGTNEVLPEAKGFIGGVSSMILNHRSFVSATYIIDSKPDKPKKTLLCQLSITPRRDSNYYLIFGENITQ
jgi:hypothetical protein